MAIELSKDIEKQLIASTKRYFLEHMEQEIGDLKASMLIDFCLQELGPTIYNEAIEDAQKWLYDKTADLENACYEQEFV